MKPLAALVRLPFALLLLVSLAIGQAVVQGAQGPLQWDRDSQSFQAAFGQEEVVATYHFTNASEREVTILKTAASCGCTVPNLEKKVYAPGESGALEAVFTIGSRQGQQRKNIEVVAEANGETTTYQLIMEVDIPVPVALKPRVRFWNVGGEPNAQEVRISLHEAMPMEIDGIAVKDQNEPAPFDYEIVTVSAGREYLLRITPQAVEERARAVFYLTSQQDRADLLRSYPIYVYVR